MAQPSYIQKHLTMKPEVTKIFDDLESFHNFCRMEMLPFNEADLYNRESKVWNSFYHTTRKARGNGQSANRGRKNYSKQ